MVFCYTVPHAIILYLQLCDRLIQPEACKIHRAIHNGVEDPLDVYFAGEFDEWQRWQNNKNFTRAFIISLISLPQRDQWLCAGVHLSQGVERADEPNGGASYRYQTQRLTETDEFDGRLIVDFTRSGRQSYLNAENWVERLQIAEIRRAKLQTPAFPGFAHTTITKQELDLIVNQEIESWKTALGSVGGVYVIADRKYGKLYVGSATGEEGIWNRWCDYARDGHGGNQLLRDLLDREGEDHAEYFQFGLLEIADARVGKEDLLARETYWKKCCFQRIPMAITRIEWGFRQNA